jgi:hypothetical protein
MEQIAEPDKGGHSFAGQQFWDRGARTAPAICRALPVKMARVFGCGAAPKPKQ